MTRLGFLASRVVQTLLVLVAITFVAFAIFLARSHMSGSFTTSGLLSQAKVNWQARWRWRFS